tara:strand:+ start:152 stop:739 length:588 start_codon:yes stop_codon:yes gene_type:complete
MEDPYALFFEEPWVLYGHVYSGSFMYLNSYIFLGKVSSIGDYFNLFHHAPSASQLYNQTIILEGKKTVAFSFFKHNVLPEWEDPINKKGSEWGCRDNIPGGLFQTMWDTFTLAAVNSEFDNVVGVRCINKTNKGRLLYKIEIWMDTDDIVKANSVLEKMKSLFDTDLPLFIHMLHEDKQQQANEYSKKKKKQCNK